MQIKTKMRNFITENEGCSLHIYSRLSKKILRNNYHRNYIAFIVNQRINCDLERYNLAIRTDFIVNKSQNEKLHRSK